MKTQLKAARRFPFFGAALVLVTVLSQRAQADESYYLIVYAAQRTPNVPRYTHTFATVVKATGEGKDRSKYKIEAHTISWIAKSKEVVLARTKPEPGINLSLQDSMRLAASFDEKVSMWGPFEIKKELYERALKQIGRLESGKVEYKAVDLRFRPETAMNCIHAVCDLDADEGLLETNTARGNEASRMVAVHLRRWMIKPEQTHAWVSEWLGLEEFSVSRRNWDD
jgi:hypothetical protein